MLSFTNFVENASACALSFKSSQSTIQRLILPYFIPPYANGQEFSSYLYRERFRLCLSANGYEKPVTKDIILHIISVCQAFFIAPAKKGYLQSYSHHYKTYRTLSVSAHLEFLPHHLLQ